MKLNTVINTKDLNKTIKEIVNRTMADVMAEYVDDAEENLRAERIKMGRDIATRLNEYERAHPRRDPALQGLRTDQWRCYIYSRKRPDKKYARDAKTGRFTYWYKLVIVNLQKPYPYRFDFINDWEGYASDKWYKANARYNQKGEVIGNWDRLNLPDWAMKTTYRFNNKTHRLTEHHTPDETKIHKQGLPDKLDDNRVGVRKRQYVGNLAAVRLSQDKGMVYPLRDRKNGWIVYWHPGFARKIRKNTPLGRRVEHYTDGKAQGYAFVKQRRKSGPGHARYRRDITAIIDVAENEFIDNLW